MTRKAAIRKKITERKDKAVTLARTIYEGDEALNGAWRRIVSAVKVLVVAGRKFVRDECFTRASSITYTIILSLVPVLTVLLSISLYSGVAQNEKDLVDQLHRIMDKYAIAMNIDPIIETILGLTRNAVKIGGISAAMMVFSATALFRTLENSLNAVWKVKKGRPIHLQVVYYWAALTLGPVLMTAGTYVAARLSALVSAATAPIAFLAPFAIIWLLFLLAYVSLPNTKVPLKPAAIGATFTGAVWVLFIMGFAVYVRSFAGGTFAVYGALAAIPLFLLMVYASSLIILYGAEVACTLMYPESYRSLKRAFGDRDELHAYRGVTLLAGIYRKFESGGGPSARSEMARAGASAEEIDTYLGLFLDSGLITQADDGTYLPAKGSARVPMNDVMDSILHVSLAVPAGASQGRRLIAKLFARITESRRAAVGRMTLKDLLDAA